MDEIIVAVGQQIRLQFHQFNLENSSNCQYDYLKITDGAVEGRKYCGKAIPPVYNSASNRLAVRFQSDSSVTGSGFFATYTVTNGSNPAGRPDMGI